MKPCFVPSFGIAIAFTVLITFNLSAAPQPRPQVVCGELHTLALDADGDVYAWGSNAYGQLGQGVKPDGKPDTDRRNTPTKIPALDNLNVIAIAAGANHNLALTSDGKVYAWGRNNAYQLGFNDALYRSTPTQITQAQLFTQASGSPHTISLPKICAIATGDEHSFAIAGEWIQTGEQYVVDPAYYNLFGDPGFRYQFVFGWGNNGSGRLGIDNSTALVAPRNISIRASAGGRIYQMAAGTAHSLLAATSHQNFSYSGEWDYRIFSTGNNTESQVGVATNYFNWYTSLNVPVIPSAGSKFSIFLRTPRLTNSEPPIQAEATGQNNQGQLGAGHVGIPKNGIILGDYRFRSISSRADHTVAVTETGEVYAWGHNRFSLGANFGYGQLAIGTTAIRKESPVLVPAFQALPVALAAAGGDHSVFVTRSGYVYGSGLNNQGQLGLGHFTTNATTRSPVLVPNFRLWQDANGNEVADSWEIRHFGLLTANLTQDHDLDGLTSLEEYHLGTHPKQSDSDGDGLPDGYEVGFPHLSPLAFDNIQADIDFDGLSELQEFQNKTHTLKADSDGDGLSDGKEVRIHQTNPLLQDTDGDGLSDWAEVSNHNTNPLSWDTDGDLLPDGWEIQYGLNPRSASGANGANGDPDGDGLSNFQEMIHGTNPLVADTDGDNVSDNTEVNQGSNPNDPGDGGQSPPPDEIIEVPFTIGDPSGSHSERWKMNIQANGPHDTRQFGFVSPDFGEMGDQTFKLRRGNTYTITISHVATNIEEGDPDYDWEAQVDSKPTTTVLAGGATHSGANRVAVIKEAWVLDNEQGLMGVVNQSFDSTNYAAGKVARFLPIDIKVHQDNPNSGPEGQARKYINAPEAYIASNLFCLWPNEQATVKVKLPPPFDQQQNLPAGLIKWTVPGHTIPDNTLEAPVAWPLGLTNNTKEVKINIGGSEFKLHFKIQGVGFLNEIEAAALVPNASPVMLAYRQESIDFGATYPVGPQQDAMRHAYWCSVSVSTFPVTAGDVDILSLAHEYRNRHSDKQQAFNSTMDIKNNGIGAMVNHQNNGLPDRAAIRTDLEQRYAAGEMFIWEIPRGKGPLQGDSEGILINSNRTRIFP